LDTIARLAGRWRNHVLVFVVAAVSSLVMFTPGTKSVSAQPAPTAALVQGRPWVGSRGVSETVGQIMARAKASPLTPERREAPPVRPVPRPKSGPSGPAASSSGTQRRGAAAVRAPQTVTTNFLGTSLSESGFVPPDAMGAVGPTQYFVGVNGRMRTFNKSTGAADGLLDVTADAFFNSVRNGSISSDPRVRYDRLSGRWIVDMITESTPNRVLLAVSSGGNITSGSSFTFFFFQQDQVTPAGDTGCFFDYDTLGVDANALYIGGNVFCSNMFAESSAFVVRKSSIMGSGPIIVTAFRSLTAGNTGPVTPQGTDNDNPSATTGYFIGVDIASFGRLVIRRVVDPGGTPAISGNINISVAATDAPINVPHLNSDGRPLDGIDDRLMNAVVRSGQLWTVHNIQVDSTGVANPGGGRNGTRWYQIQNLDTTPSVAQFGTVFDPAATTPLSYWMPSIMTSAQGHTALGGSVAGANHFADAWTAGRLAGDATGSTQAPFLYTSSTSAYNPTFSFPDNPHRWGDYSFVSPDPDDGMTMWTIQEYTNAANSWGVQVAKLLAPPPAMPVSANPASVPQGLTSVSVTVTGLQMSGSAFFDPGPGYPKRISAAVGGGVVVNSVTYVSPTQVVLDLNTTGASAAADNVSITNPDGQSATGNGILTVGGGTFHALSPSRILDTRDGTGGVPAAPIGPGGTLTVQVAGRGGVPTSGVSAAVLNVTGTNTTASSFLTVYPAGVTRPLASNLNWVSGATVPNLVEVSMGTGGQLSIFNLAGNVDVIFDVEGWVGDSSNSNGPDGMFNPLPPFRLLDTRNGGGPVGPGQSITLQVTGQGGVPATGVSAVVLNVTVTDTTAPSYLTVWPAGTSRPLASNLNFTAGQTVPNRVMVKVGSGGQVNIFNFSGSTDVVVDVGGWFTDATNTSGGSRFVAVVPTRIFDSRSNGAGPLPGGSSFRIASSAVPGSATALVLNVTATDATASSFLTVWPDGTVRPLASDLNFVAGQTIPNLTVVKLGSGAFDVFNFQGGVDVVVDMNGFYGPAVPPLTGRTSATLSANGAPGASR
jgi:hypothetical protein